LYSKCLFAVINKTGYIYVDNVILWNLGNDPVHIVAYKAYIYAYTFRAEDIVGSLRTIYNDTYIIEYYDMVFHVFGKIDITINPGEKLVLRNFKIPINLKALYPKVSFGEYFGRSVNPSEFSMYLDLYLITDHHEYIRICIDWSDMLDLGIP
jgi:hypothetical protein